MWQEADHSTRTSAPGQPVRRCSGEIRPGARPARRRLRSGSGKAPRPETGQPLSTLAEFSAVRRAVFLATWTYRIAHHVAASHVMREHRLFLNLVSLEELDRMPAVSAEPN